MSRFLANRQKSRGTKRKATWARPPPIYHLASFLFGHPSNSPVTKQTRRLRLSHLPRAHIKSVDCPLLRRHLRPDLLTSIHIESIHNHIISTSNIRIMATVSLLNVSVRNNPAPFNAPYIFEITFECLEPLQKDIEWKLTYVGSATS